MEAGQECVWPNRQLKQQLLRASTSRKDHHLVGPTHTGTAAHTQGIDTIKFAHMKPIETFH